MGEDAKFMTDVQFIVEPNSTGTEWILTHSPSAKNQSLVNGVFQSGPVTLKNGDVVSVGNAAKNVAKLPMTVRLVAGT
jgi:hypothetical protein